MAKIAVVVLADAETHGDLGRVVNAMILVREASEQADDIRLYFDGAGVRWIGKLSDPDHKSHALFESVREHITGVCEYCSNAFGVLEEVKRAGAPLASEYKQHPSLRTVIVNGFSTVTF